jgi:hypothetical protein
MIVVTTAAKRKRIKKAIAATKKHSKTKIKLTKIPEGPKVARDASSSIQSICYLPRSSFISAV